MQYEELLQQVMIGDPVRTYRLIDIYKVKGPIDRFQFTIGKTYKVSSMEEAESIINKHYNSLSKSIK